MKRTLLSTLVVTSALGMSSNVSALGMGELDLKSALNQPLEAEIELLNIDDLSSWEIKPALASTDEFERAGVERLFFLADIDFTVEGNRIVLKTDKPVTEPFLNFLVQVNWPTGRVMREYTLLLDPPVFDEDIQPLNALAPASSDDAQVVESQAVAPAKVNRWETEEAAPGTYKVQPNDTLWEIAVNTRPDRSVTPQQMMLAIQDSNPNAFIAGNINRLKTHQVLRIPSEDEMSGRSFGQAVAEVKRQNKALKPGSAQLDATSSAGTSTQVDQLADGGELKLLSNNADVADSAGASGDVESGADGAGRRDGMENDLAIALETLDKSKLENNELKDRLAALEEQISTLQKLVSLKDDQLATIQTLEAQDQVETDADPLDASSELGEIANQETNAIEASDVQELALEGDTTEEVDFNYQEEPATEQSELVDEAISQDDSQLDAAGEVDSTLAQESVTEEVVDPAVEAANNAVREQALNRYKPKSFVDQLLAKPEMLGAIGGGLLLLIGLIGMALKKRKSKAEEGEIDDPELAGYGENFDFDDENLEGDSLDDFEFEEDGATEDELNDDLLEGIGTDADDELDVEEKDTVAQTSDIIGEADIYIAYGRFDQAVELLQNSIAAEPSRIDLRIKLLEVFVETDDAGAFAKAEADLASLGDAQAVEKATSLRGRLSAPVAPMGAEDVAGSTDLSLDTDGLADLGAGEDEFADGLDFEAALDLTEGDESSVAPELSDDEQDFASALDAMELEGDSEDVGLEFDLSEDVPELGADDDLAGLDDLADLGEDDAPSFENDALEFDLADSEDVPELDEEDLVTGGLEEVSDLSELTLDDELSVDSDDLDFDLAAELESDDTSVTEEALLETEIPSLDDVDELEIPELDAAGLDSPDLSADLPTLEAAEEAESDLSELESLLDASDDAGAGELPDFDLDMEGTGFAESDLEDLQSLEGELDALTETAEAAPEATDAVEDIAPVIEEDLSAAGSEFDLDDLDDVPSFDEALQQKAAEKPEAQAAPEADQGIDLDELAASEDEFDFLAGTDECATKLDLARAYIDMEDNDGAKELLQEVVSEGSDQQKQDARALLDSLG